MPDAMGGISIHIARLAFGLGFIGSLANAAGGGTALFTLAGASRMADAVANDATVQRNVAVSAAGYLAARAIGPSVEKAPMISLGKLRVYVL